MPQSPTRLCVYQALHASIGLLIFGQTARATSYSSLYSFSGTNAAKGIYDGQHPTTGPLVQSGSLLYGMSFRGGTNNAGTIFQFDTVTNSEMVLHSLGNNDAGPTGSLIQSGSVLYGLAVGTSTGSIFQYDTSTSGFETLHNFASNGSEGYRPWGSLIRSGSMLYGTTNLGGGFGNGTIFSYDTSINAFKVLYRFAGGSDGGEPYGTLTLSGSVLYGMTSSGGGKNLGTIFKYDLNTDTETVLHSFSGGTSDGADPKFGGALLVSGTSLYGVTHDGGSSNKGTLFRCDAASGALSVLHSFGASSGDGYSPYDSLILVDSTLYGTTDDGGTNIGSFGGGTVFQYALSSNAYTIDYRFNVPPDGDGPQGTLLLSGSTLYGTTSFGGAKDAGTLFSISIPEPSSLALLAVGGLVLAQRRRVTTAKLAIDESRILLKVSENGLEGYTYLE